MYVVSKKVNQDDLQKVIWSEVQAEVALVNPGLASLIEGLGLNDDHFFYRANYRYGTYLVNKGVFHLPAAEGNVLPLGHGSFSTEIQDELGYSPMPLGLILKNSSEKYYENNGHVISLDYLEPGSLLGLAETLAPHQAYFPWHLCQVSAGARSLFMLAKIADALGHERLKREYRFRSLIPKQLSEHANIFSDITKQGNWRLEVLYFSKKWFDNHNTNTNNTNTNNNNNDNNNNKKSLVRLRHYLLEQAWKLTHYPRNEAARNMVWGLFSAYLTKKRVKLSPYVLNVLKQVVSISLGGALGFKPTGTSEAAGPIQEIQRAYVEVYHLIYLPVIMQPAYYDKTAKPNYLYTSLNLPTVCDPTTETQQNNTLLKELRTVKMVWNLFLDAAMEGKLCLEGTPMQDIINNVKLEFFHNENDVYGEIDLSSSIPDSDPSMLEVFAAPNKKEFPSASQFFRGGIRLSRIV